MQDYVPGVGGKRGTVSSLGVKAGVRPTARSQDDITHLKIAGKAYEGEIRTLMATLAPNTPDIKPGMNVQDLMAVIMSPKGKNITPEVRAKLDDLYGKYSDAQTKIAQTALGRVKGVERPVSATQSPSSQPTDEEPPDNILQEGKVTTFENGQRWTLTNGKKVKIQ